MRRRRRRRGDDGTVAEDLLLEEHGLEGVELGEAGGAAAVRLQHLEHLLRHGPERLHVEPQLRPHAPLQCVVSPATAAAAATTTTTTGPVRCGGEVEIDGGEPNGGGGHLGRLELEDEAGAHGHLEEVHSAPTELLVQLRRH